MRLENFYLSEEIIENEDNIWKETRNFFRRVAYVVVVVMLCLCFVRVQFVKFIEKTALVRNLPETTDSCNKTIIIHYKLNKMQSSS